MKRTILLTLSALIISGSVWADRASTTVFDSAFLRIGPEAGDFDYLDLPKISVGLSARLPVATYYVSLEGNERSSDISWQIETGRPVATVDAQQALRDIPTADTPETYAEAIAMRDGQRLGESPVHVAETIFKDGEKWVKLLIFPVNISPNGECLLNESLSISVRNRVLAPENLLTSIGESIIPTSSVSIVQLPPPDSTIDYLIVTSSLLHESSMELAYYRSSLGIRTSVELIDDILAVFSGRDDAERLRERLKEFHHDGGQYVLMAGDESQLPIRHAYPYSTSTPPSADLLQICDLYYADLTGEWDMDNDGIWGEKYTDQADLSPELIVGRLPFSTPAEMNNYIDKLIAYETNPGNGDYEYLEKAFIFSSDEMRDYSVDGQHATIAGTYPDYFQVDTTQGVELAAGNDPSPYNLTGPELMPILSEGYGIVNVISHGDHQSFGVRTSGYNQWPKSYMMTADGGGVHGDLNVLEPNHKVSFYYSLACDNGAFDKDQPPFNYPQLNLVECLLGLKDAGAVGFVANARWGWVSSSYLIQRAFFDSLFADPDGLAAHALYGAKATYTVYRDQVFGLNYFGDPLLKVYTAQPEPMSLALDNQGANLIVNVSSNGTIVDGCAVIVSQVDTILQRCVTGSDGRAVVTCDLELDQQYTIAAVKSGFANGRTAFVMTVVTDVENDIGVLPRQFSLFQNYPNPFNPSTTIGFELAASSAVRLVVYNVLGQAVSILRDETLTAGEYYAEWDGTDYLGNHVASGIYFYRLETTEFTDVKKMILVR